MRTRSVLAGIGIVGALAIGGFAAPAQAASESVTAQVRTGTEVAPSAACTDWFDKAGHRGAGRYHVKCTGYYVKVWVTCSSGSPVNGAKRKDYQKAECRNGARITSGGFKATRS
ncbi:hypothetical protein AB0I60_02750 [Actinosynnema sp. NPDC050436]|uniref:hypothetical protein n=1 Tax=Actinosynnema sp. NPDC050436 TaxID=3155659 RepID=UPI0033D4EE3D